MKKLRKYIEAWIDGKKESGISVSLYDIHEVIDVYNAIARKEKPCFINGNVKKILDSSGIKTVKYGVGWRVM